MRRVEEGVGSGGEGIRKVMEAEEDVCLSAAV
jgi:hypothetical protein